MYYTTPLLQSPYFSQSVFLKLENTQPSGSFKSRGMTKVVETAVAKTPNCHVFACSGGNAGLAAAEAAAAAGVKCTVVLPTTSKQRMLERIKKLGAETLIYGAYITEADVKLQELMANAEAAGESVVYCHPFDNPLIWEGHSSMVLEIADQLKQYKKEKPAAIVLSCGGGGLYLGVIEGLKKLGWAESVPVVVVETEGAPTFHGSLAVGQQVQLSSINTVATSLAVGYVPEHAIEMGRKYNSKSVLVSDEQAVKAIKRFASDHCMIVEPACAATLSAIYDGHLQEFASKGPIVAIVCGGSVWGTVDG